MTHNVNKFYYISSGAKNAMRTLRSVVNIPGVHFKDEYVVNLARDHDKAVLKARSIIGTVAILYADGFDLNDWGVNVDVNPWMTKQLNQIDNGRMPFGKHVGSDITSLPESYVKYWIKMDADNVVGQRLVQVFTDLANERDYFSKWEAEELVRVANLQKLAYVGEIGKRQVLTMTCNKVLEFSGYYGTTFINLCTDPDGNKIVYKGSGRWAEGSEYEVKATVKKHETYKDEPQTHVNRPAVIKVNGVSVT